jgi:hypothetical protein
MAMCKCLKVLLTPFPVLNISAQPIYFLLGLVHHFLMAIGPYFRNLLYHFSWPFPCLPPSLLFLLVPMFRCHSQINLCCDWTLVASFHVIALLVRITIAIGYPQLIILGFLSTPRALVSCCYFFYFSIDLVGYFLDWSFL